MMAKYRAIPEGFMTVGQLAKKMGLLSVLYNTTIKRVAFPIGRK